jgi:hypothetical protein
MIFSFSIVSAQSLTITPSSININAYPGESILVPITITTDGNVAVLFNSSNKEIKIYPESLVVHKITNIELNLTISKDAIPGEIYFNIFSSTEMLEKKIVIEGEDIEHFYPVYINNNTIINNTCSNTSVISDNCEKENKYKFCSKYIFYICLSVGIIIFLYIIYNILSKRKNKDERRFFNHGKSNNKLKKEAV